MLGAQNNSKSKEIVKNIFFLRSEILEWNRKKNKANPGVFAFGNFFGKKIM